MSSTTPSGLGSIAKVTIVLMGVIGLEYAGVLIQLISNPNLNLTWKIIMGLLTPLLMIIVLIISKTSENKTANFFIIFFVTFINLLYLLLPINTSLTKGIYHGESMIISTLLISLFSLITTLLLLSGIVLSIYFIFTLLKRS
jgi:hypothetical protein